MKIGNLEIGINFRAVGIIRHLAGARQFVLFGWLDGRLRFIKWRESDANLA